MKFLFDTNVILDVLLMRSPWYQDGYALWQANDQGKIQGHVSATTVTDIFYVSRRFAGPTGALEAVKTCLNAFSVIAVDHDLLDRATQLPGLDFEDNLQIVCAVMSNMDAIVTRNSDDFVQASLPIFSPADALQKLSNR